MEPHVGQLRVFFEYDRCSSATVIAQQVFDEQSSEFTFRKWNPEKLMVPTSEKTDQESEETLCGPLFCYMCMCVAGCFNTVLEEVVDHATDEIKTADAYFR